jgi:hypothetical protein
MTNTQDVTNDKDRAAMLKAAERAGQVWTAEQWAAFMAKVAR